MSEIKKIAALLGADGPDRRIAAAIVLGELRARDAAVVDGLVPMVESGQPPLQLPALEALARIGAKRALPSLFPLLTRGDREVRRAAGRAIASVGEEVVPKIRARMAEADPEEKRVLDEILAELGGKDAFAALLDGLFTEDVEAARAAAVAVRHKVKEADPKERKRYLAQTQKFLDQKRTKTSATATAGAVKILGYLEDEAAVPTLVANATAAKAPALVRQEALIGLRFALGKKTDVPKLAEKLLGVAETAELAVARTALDTLSNLQLPPALAARLEKLAVHPDAERARFAIDRLSRMGGAKAFAVLTDVLAGQERSRAELAAAALAGKEEAAPLLAEALLAAKDPDRAWLVGKVLRPLAGKLPPKARKKLLSHAVQRIAAGDRGWEAPLAIARAGDAAGTAEALRELAERLKKSKKVDKALAVFRLLCRSEHATDDDRYVLASLELAGSRRDVHPSARAQDEALKLLGQLVSRGWDVGAAIRKDRSLDLEDRFYVGFHFVEAAAALGEELLVEVAQKAGRTKLGKMAKNKLRLAGLDE